MLWLNRHPLRHLLLESAHLFDHSPTPLNKSLEKAHHQSKTFSQDILSPQFHQELMNVGNRVFGVSP